jgi:hypothetical protein
MPFEAKQRVVAIHAMPVIHYPHEGNPAALDCHFDRARLRVQAILNQLLDDGRWPFNDFARGHLTGHGFREQSDPAHGREAGLAAWNCVDFTVPRMMEITKTGMISLTSAAVKLLRMLLAVPKPLRNALVMCCMGLAGMCLNACAPNTSGQEPRYALSAHDGSLYRRLTEKELLQLLPRLSQDKKAVALALLFSRFAPNRKLQNLSKWRAVWQEFPETRFYSESEASIIRMGAVIFKDGIGNYSKASITVYPGSEREFDIRLAISVMEDTAHFEQILRGTTRDETGCKVLDVCCMLPDGRNFISK